MSSRKSTEKTVDDDKTSDGASHGLAKAQEGNPLHLLSHVAVESGPMETTPSPDAPKSNDSSPGPQVFKKRKLHEQVDRIEDLTSSSLVVRAAKDRPKNKRGIQASRFCHVCSRTRAKVPQLICINFTKGLCRKVVCQKCFQLFGWDWEASVSETSKWICPHCCGSCPERAQCSIYTKTNMKRKQQLSYAKQLKTES